MEVHPIGGHFVAEVRGLDLKRPLSPGEVGALKAAWERYLILVFRGLDLTPAEHKRFGAYFGELWPHPASPAVLAEHPEIYVLANAIDGNPDFRPQQADFWHTDITYMPRPSRAGILYARMVPETGGDTSFADMRRAWATLPPKMQQRLLPLTGVHGLEGFPERYRKMAGKAAPVLGDNAPERRLTALQTHPAVIRDPDTGEPALFTNPGFTIRFEGMGEEESQALVDELCRHATAPGNTYRHKWRVGDMVMWDNFNTMHMAMGGYQLPMRRVMHRLTVGGPELAPALAG